MFPPNPLLIGLLRNYPLSGQFDLMQYCSFQAHKLGSLGICSGGGSLNLQDKKSKWFLLFIFVKEKKECYWKLFDDITDILKDDFKFDNFSREELS